MKNKKKKSAGDFAHSACLLSPTYSKNSDDWFGLSNLVSITDQCESFVTFVLFLVGFCFSGFYLSFFFFRLCLGYSSSWSTAFLMVIDLSQHQRHFFLVVAIGNLIMNDRKETTFLCFK